MLPIIWGFDGFHVVNLMTEQHSYNIHDFLGNTIEPLLHEILPDGRKPCDGPLNLHFENFSIHGSKASDAFLTENDIVRLPHPADSPGLAVSDFGLYGHIERAPAEQ
jgi:hypothetical protein